ncbi:MAG: carboxymuconolactone decarboxylase family protein [Thaumarchaeota archaeon]|nr:carboxymuconolactone decarboxylase family protein [Nitrososphaerota archaeon]
MTTLGTRKESRLSKWIYLGAILAVATFLTTVGLTDLSVWRFDVAVIGSFLFGDYVSRWLLERRRVRALLRVNPPSMFRPALSYGWFFIIIFIVGDMAFLAAFLAGILYGGTIPPLLIALLSLAMSMALGVDYRDHYMGRKGLKPKEQESADSSQK